MAEETHLHKFPRTKHLFDAGDNDVSREDLLFSEDDAKNLFMSGKHDVVIEEKIDGANIGFSIAEGGKVMAQNRSHFVNSATHPQFKHIDEWISSHIGELYDILEGPEKFVLFGEWVFAKHSVAYNALPDYFVAFDIYDCTAQRFLSRKDFHQRLKDTSIRTIPTIATQPLKSKEDVIKFLDTKSQFGDGPVEGVVLRVDDEMLPADEQQQQQQEGGEGDEAKTISYLARRAKVVRPDFLQGMKDHWAGHDITLNQIKYPEE